MADNSNVGLRLYNATGGSHGENRVERCVLRNNLSSGIMMTAVSNTVIEACTVSGQAGRGIEMELSNHNTVMGCLIVKNTGSAGILVSQGKGHRIEGNRVIDNWGQSDRGIWTSISEKNLIVRNICIGQASNYDLDTDDTYGPIVTDTGELSAGTAAAHPGPISRAVISQEDMSGRSGSCRSVFCSGVAVSGVQPAGWSGLGRSRLRRQDCKDRSGSGNGRRDRVGCCTARKGRRADTERGG
jgi:hypothetical protein